MKKVKLNTGGILKILFIILALLIFIYRSASYLLSFEDVVAFISNLFNIDYESLTYRIPYDHLYIQIQRIFYFISLISAAIGTVVFSRGRSFIDALGIFVAFIIPRKRKLSGTVYDINKSQPIAFTSIRIIRKQASKETVVASAITDLDGKYKIYLDEITESLYIQARASGYAIYEKELTGLYKNTVIQDIPLKNETNIQSKFKTLYYNIRPRLYNFLIYYLYILSIIVFLYLLYGPLFIFGFNLSSLFVIVLYGVAVCTNTITILERHRFTPGKIIDFEEKTPVPSAIVSILDEEKQLQAVFSDINGVVRANLKSGMYKIKASKPGYEMVDAEGNEIDYKMILIDKDGYLPENILMKKSPEKEISKSTDLTNPFN